MKLESKTGTVPSSEERIFNFLSDFTNFKQLIPTDRVSDWESDADSCSFSVHPIGKTGIKIVEKEPYSLLKLSSLDESKFQFLFWLQLKPAGENTTHIKLTLDARLNAMMEMMAKKPLQEFLDKLVDQLTRFSF